MKPLSLILMLAWAWPGFAQSSGNVTMVIFLGTPTGSCNARQLGLNQSTGALYTCNNNTWQVVSSGVPTTAPGDTVYGNNLAVTSAPSFFTPGGDVSFSSGNFSVNALHFGPNGVLLANTGIATGNCLQISGSTVVGGPCGTGSGTQLTGCSTPTSGNLVCNNSVTGGTGPVGMMTLPYASTGLPAPPTTALAAIAANASGTLYWSPGNSTAFTAIELSGPSEPATALNFGGTTISLGSVPAPGQVLGYDGTYITGTTPTTGTGGTTTDLVVVASGATYTLPSSPPTNPWCVNVIATTGSGQQVLVPPGGTLNGQTQAISLPLFQMLHICGRPPGA